MADILQSCTWPGMAVVESAQYVCSHGITPGSFVISGYPETSAPEEFGDLTFSDGKKTVTIVDCKVDSITPTYTSGEGTRITLKGLDRRWRWVGLGGITGRYNQKDDRQKLVPWTIRSPQEMAFLCLKEMGEVGAIVQLPQGLSRASGRDQQRYLKAGENFPQSLTNPEMTWEKTPPAEALSQLAEFFGCRVVFQPIHNRVLVVPLGSGKTFPIFPYESLSPTIDGPESPRFVGVFGSPVKIQARFILEAVGEEWDGTYIPINELSYAPVSKDQKVQISKVNCFAAADPVNPLQVTISFTDPKTNQPVTVTAVSTNPAFSRIQRYNEIDEKLSKNPDVVRNIKIGPPVVDDLPFAGKTAFPFSIEVSDPSVTGLDFKTEMAQPFQNPLLGCWGNSHPPFFGNVQATNRLSFTEAQQKARNSVFRCFRIVNRSASQPKIPIPGQKNIVRPLVLPWFGKVKRRQQIILQSSKVEQVIPAARIPGAINKANEPALKAPNIAGQGVLPEFYNGYSRAQKNTVTGSIWAGIGNANWMFFGAPGNAGRNNTAPTDRVFLDFEVNAVEQMIVFSDHVFEWIATAGSQAIIKEPVLTLEAGVFVLSEETNQPIRWEEILPITGGTGPTEWRHREDVEVGIIGRYDDADRLTGFDSADIIDAKSRAGYYLRGMARRWNITGGETRQYIGIIPHEPDGYCQQVSWSVGDGATTIVSGNVEFHPAIPPYPTRRRAELLPPNKLAEAANLEERARWDEIKPKES